jgi:hypothetical protein
MAKSKVDALFCARAMAPRVMRIPSGAASALGKKLAGQKKFNTSPSAIVAETAAMLFWAIVGFGTDHDVQGGRLAEPAKPSDQTIDLAA